ncbi:hypothetical protein [Bacillus sp. NTK074B]
MAQQTVKVAQVFSEVAQVSWKVAQVTLQNNQKHNNAGIFHS